MKNHVKVSIIVPIYNSEIFLNNCIRSLVEQTEKNIEIILINDGSIDNSINVINKWKNIDNRIKILNNKTNKGVSYCRNLGIEMSNGEYLFFLDSDDWIDKNTIENLYETIIKYKVDYVRFCYVKEFIDINKKLKQNIDIKKTYITQNEYSDYVYDQFINTYNFNSASTGIIKRKFLIDNEIKFTEKYKYGEDYEFNLKLISKLNHIVWLQNYYYHYRTNIYSYTMNLTKESIKMKSMDAIEIYSKLHKYIKKWKVDDESNIEKINERIYKEVVNCLKQLFNCKCKIKANEKLKVVKEIRDNLRNIKIRNNNLTKIEMYFYNENYILFILYGNILLKFKNYIKYLIKNIICNFTKKRSKVNKCAQ